MRETEYVRLEESSGYAVLTIDRPHALNALSCQVLDEVEGILEECSRDVGCLIIRGTGNRSFIAGGDIAEMSTLDQDGAREYSEHGHRVLNLLEKFPVPVIAGVSGYALGGGCEVVLACDFAIATRGSTFGQPEVGLGLIPGFGGCCRLHRKVGSAWARRLVYTTERISAEQALRIGLITEVVEATEFEQRLRELAETIARQSRSALRSAKRAMLFSENALNQADIHYEQTTFSLCFAGPDAKEGTSAFIDKRSPQWSQ